MHDRHVQPGEQRDVVRGCPDQVHGHGVPPQHARQLIERLGVALGLEQVRRDRDAPLPGQCDQVGVVLEGDGIWRVGRDAGGDQRADRQRVQAGRHKTGRVALVAERLQVDDCPQALLDGRLGDGVGVRAVGDGRDAAGQAGVDGGGGLRQVVVAAQSPLPHDQLLDPGRERQPVAHRAHRVVLEVGVCVHQAGQDHGARKALVRRQRRGHLGDRPVLDPYSAVAQRRAVHRQYPVGAEDHVSGSGSGSSSRPRSTISTRKYEKP